MTTVDLKSRAVDPSTFNEPSTVDNQAVVDSAVSKCGDVAADNGEKKALNAVAEHYNAVPQPGLSERTKSRIFYQRNFNNWIKSMLIGEYLRRIQQDGVRGIRVLDLCCGKGGDLLKWKIGGIKHLICADIADVSLQQCEERYKEMVEREKQERRPRGIFSAEFLHADCTRVDITELEPFTKEGASKLDMCSIQFSLHYCFESLEQTRTMLKNACAKLKPGGFLVGTLPDSETIVSATRNSPDGCFKNEVCSIEFEDKNAHNKDYKHPLFGSKYFFHLDEVVNCPEYLVYFPLLEKILSDEFDMELVSKKHFNEMLDSFGGGGHGRQLLGRMQALEPYPPDKDVVLMGGDDQYEYANGFWQRQQRPQHDDNKKLGTLSKSESEVAAMYLAFAFRKRKSL